MKRSEAICVCSWEQNWTSSSSEVNFLCDNDCTENITSKSFWFIIQILYFYSLWNGQFQAIAEAENRMQPQISAAEAKLCVELEEVKKGIVLQMHWGRTTTKWALKAYRIYPCYDFNGAILIFKCWETWLQQASVEQPSFTPPGSVTQFVTD